MMNQKNKVIYPITLIGEVVHGKGLGRTVGMPTANLQVIMGDLPATGVYATRIQIGDKFYDSVTNIGRRPSVDQDKQITVETYILDYHEDIYGKNVMLEVCRFLRPVRKFHSLEEVRKQVEKDIEKAKKYL